MVGGDRFMNFIYHISILELSYPETRDTFVLDVKVMSCDWLEYVMC